MIRRSNRCKLGYHESMIRRFPECPILFSGVTLNETHPDGQRTIYGDLVRLEGKYYIHPIGNVVHVENTLTKNPMVLHEIDPKTIKVIS